MDLAKSNARDARPHQDPEAGDAFCCEDAWRQGRAVGKQLERPCGPRSRRRWLGRAFGCCQS